MIAGKWWRDLPKCRHIALSHFEKNSKYVWFGSKLSHFKKKIKVCYEGTSTFFSIETLHALCINHKFWNWYSNLFIGWWFVNTSKFVNRHWELRWITTFWNSFSNQKKIVKSWNNSMMQKNYKSNIVKYAKSFFFKPILIYDEIQPNQLI